MKGQWPQAVIFDMDGLMFDTEQQIQRTWNAVGPDFAGEPMGYNIYQTMGMNRAMRVRYFKTKYGEEFPFDEFEQAYRSLMREYTRREGVPVKPGLFQLLELLKEEQIPAVVATGSSRAHAMDNLEQTGVLGYFQFVIAGDMVRYAKPDPEIYRITCEKLKVQPEEALVLEDSWNGVKSSYAAGVPVILIPDLQKDSGPVEGLYYKKMESLGDVADWLYQKRHSEDQI